MRVACHFITPSVDPARGGLQELGARLARGLSARADITVIVHALSQMPEDGPGQGFELHHLLPERRRLAEPLLDDDPTVLTMAAMSAQGFRVNQVTLLNSLDRAIGRLPEARHVVVSFSLVRLGHTAQQLADLRSLPHVAAVTGSDFALDLADPNLFCAAAQVVSKADWIVTTNDAQLAALSRIFGRRERISTSIGALAEVGSCPVWQPHGGGVVRVVSDCGYSAKKATHLLIDACRQLRARGRPITLTVVGRTERGEERFWDRLRAAASAQDSEWMELASWLPKEQLTSLLLSGDIYGSASLSEGSSNAVLSALALGMPMVCTAAGSLPALAEACDDRVLLVPPGDGEGLVDGLEVMLGRVRDRQIAPALQQCAWLRRRLAPDVEIDEWAAVLAASVAEA